MAVSLWRTVARRGVAIGSGGWRRMERSALSLATDRRETTRRPPGPYTGPATDVRLRSPYEVEASADGGFMFADRNGLHRVGPDGLVQTGVVVREPLHELPDWGTAARSNVRDGMLLRELTGGSFVPLVRNLEWLLPGVGRAAADRADTNVLHPPRRPADRRSGLRCHYPVRDALRCPARNPVDWAQRSPARDCRRCCAVGLWCAARPRPRSVWSSLVAARSQRGCALAASLGSTASCCHAGSRRASTG